MKGRDGYSLFEVMIAFAIMAMVLAVLIPRHTDLIGRARNIDARLAAQEFALSKMAALGIELPLETGRFEETQGEFSLKQEISAFRLRDTEIELLEIVITVTTGNGRELSRLREWRVAQ